MAAVLVDSDVLIDVLRNVPGVAERLAALAMAHGLATTTITMFEVVRGAATDAVASHFFSLIGDFDVVPIDLSAAVEAARAWKEVRRAGTPVDTGDLLIAGAAVANGMRPLTRNLRDFDRIPGLVLVEF